MQNSPSSISPISLAPSGWLTAVSILLLSVFAHNSAQGQITEWTLEDRGLTSRTTSLLERYYTFTRPDSLRLRYIRSNSGILPYRFRGILVGQDSVTALLWLRIGQLTIFPTENLRIALGEELYAEILATRQGSEGRTLPFGEGFGGGEWDDNRRLVIALDRVDLRVAENVGAFAAIGAPESNLDWWTDGTARAGVVSPEWEFAVLIPFASGNVGVGPFRKRLLEPAYGATGTGRAGGFRASLRLATTLDADADTTSDSAHRFVHTAGGSASYTFAFSSEAGLFRCDIGAGMEEFTPVGIAPSGDDDGIIRRFSPTVGLLWSNYTRTLQGEVGVGDLALRFSFAARLTGSLTVELRAVSNTIFRQHEEFEHPFYLFLTPRLSF